MPKTDLPFSGDGYAPVSDRVRLFYQRYPMGRIVTYLVRRTSRDVMFRAEVYRMPADGAPAATGWAVEREGDGDINTVACLENTETSAVGRALANLGFTASPHRPSREEMDKASRVRARVHRVAERPARKPAPDVQRRADRATELLTLLNHARHLGLSGGKVAVLTTLVTRVDTGDGTLARVERRLRDWLERRFDQAPWGQ